MLPIYDCSRRLRPTLHLPPASRRRNERGPRSPAALAPLGGGSSALGQDDAPDATLLRPVQEHARVARRLPAEPEGRQLELLDLGLRAVKRQTPGVAADDPQLVVRQDEGALEVLE